MICLFQLLVWNLAKLLKTLLLITKVVILKQNFYFHLYLETLQQEKTAHNNHVNKKAARKESKLVAAIVVIICFYFAIRCFKGKNLHEIKFAKPKTCEIFGMANIQEGELCNNR